MQVYSFTQQYVSEYAGPQESRDSDWPDVPALTVSHTSSYLICKTLLVLLGPPRSHPSLHVNLLPSTQERNWVLLWFLPCWQHNRWLKHSKAQPQPHGSLSVCSNKPPPWLTLDIITQQALGSCSVKMVSLFTSLTLLLFKTTGNQFFFSKTLFCFSKTQ